MNTKLRLRGMQHNVGVVLLLLCGCASDTSGVSGGAQAAPGPSTGGAAAPVTAAQATSTPGTSAVQPMQSAVASASSSMSASQPGMQPAANAAPTPPPPANTATAGVPAPADTALASFLGDASWQIDCAASPPAKSECSLPIAAGTEWTLEKILKLSRQQVMDMWSQAPPAAVGELDGEYIGLAPNAGDSRAQSDIASRLYNEGGPLGYWLGKTYKPAPEGDMMGEGYNRWRHTDKQTMHSMRFATRPGTSLIDQNPAFMMFYSAFSPSNTLTDELRKVDAHVYIGLATMQSGSGRTSPDHFVLVGPAKPWSEF